jgi:hypothetical protein
MGLHRARPHQSHRNWVFDEAITASDESSQSLLDFGWAFTEHAHTRVTETGFSTKLSRPWTSLHRAFSIWMGLHRACPHQSHRNWVFDEAITASDESSQSLLDLDGPSQSMPTPESQKLDFRQDYHGLGRVFTEPTRISGPSQSMPTPVLHRACWISCRFTEFASFRCPNAQITVQA